MASRFYQSAFNPPDQARAAPQPAGQAGWEVVTPRADRRAQPRQQPITDGLPLGGTPNVPRQLGWEAVGGYTPRRPVRQQPAGDAAAVLPPTAGGALPGAAPQGWDAVQSGQPQATRRQQPILDQPLTRIVPGQPAGQAGWAAECGQPRRAGGRQQPANEVLVRVAAAVAAAPQGWANECGQPRRQVPRRQPDNDPPPTATTSAAATAAFIPAFAGPGMGW